MPRLRIGFTNGCFDFITSAHIRLFQFAREHCDRLYVGVNDDASVRALKGASRPINSLVDRLIVLNAVRCVDMTFVFSESTPIRLIEELRPDLLVKGADYSLEQIVGAELVAARGGSVLIFPIVAGQSSTRIIEAIS